MAFLHKEAAAGRWQKFSLEEQLANIGSEISRAKNWQNRDKKIFWGAVERALGLFNLTLSDKRWKGRSREIVLTKELFSDAVLGGKEYKTSLADLEKYFFNFAILARRKF